MRSAAVRGIVTAGGLVTAMLLAALGGADLVAQADAAFAVLLGCLILGELRVVVRSMPVRVETSTGSVFAFALLLSYGTTAAALGMALGSILGDVARPKPIRQALLNAALWTLTCAAAGVVLAGLRGWPDAASSAVSAAELPEVACAAVTWFAVNFLLVMSISALDAGRPVATLLREEIWLAASEDVAGLSVATVIALAGVRLATLPLLALPFILTQGGREVVATGERAMHDPLTALPNRALFVDRAQQALRRAERDGSGGAMLLVDLDGFKAVNDSLGHQAGDELLEQVAARIVGCVRAVDTVGRLGGDEFALVIAADENPDTAADRVRDKIVAAIDEPFQMASSECRIGASVGIARFPEEATDVAALLERADAAMYRDKDTRTAGRERR